MAKYRPSHDGTPWTFKASVPADDNIEESSASAAAASVSDGDDGEAIEAFAKKKVKKPKKALDDETSGASDAAESDGNADEAESPEEINEVETKAVEEPDQAKEPEETEEPEKAEEPEESEEAEEPKEPKEAEQADEPFVFSTHEKKEKREKGALAAKLDSFGDSIRAVFKKHGFKRAVILAAVALAVIIACILNIVNIIPPTIHAVTVSDFINEDNTMNVTAEVTVPALKFKQDIWCLISESAESPSPADEDWVKAENGSVTFSVDGPRYYVFAKDAGGRITEAENPVKIDRVISVSLNSNVEKYYLAPEAERELSADVAVIGEADSSISWSSSNVSVASVSSDGKLKALSVGDATITASTPDGTSDSIEVMVTDIIKLPAIDNDRPRLNGVVYTPEEAALLDEILFSHIDEGGYMTRAGVVAAARFLALEFKYEVPYFFENGRLDPVWTRPVCDGEGRYYHRGLYLSEDKYEELSVIRYGPAFWGMPLLNWEDTPYIWKPGNKYPNGLTCSGFTVWSVLNGGFDVGDIGAGEYEGYVDCCDLGEPVRATTEMINSGRVKPGDLIGWDGHAAVIIGLDEENVYIAETLSYLYGITVTTVPRQRMDYTLYTYICLMDSVYIEQGEYTDMW